jgi:hypothetical protein
VNLLGVFKLFNIVLKLISMIFFTLMKLFNNAVLIASYSPEKDMKGWLCVVSLESWGESNDGLFQGSILPLCC